MKITWDQINEIARKHVVRYREDRCFKPPEFWDTRSGREREAEFFADAVLEVLDTIGFDTDGID